MCATSSRQASSWTSASCCAFGGVGCREVPDQRDADRAGVEALRVRADHVLVDAAAATLVDRAEAVDEKVVADVVPAVSLHVVDLDPAHDRRRLRARVGVRAGRVVDDREPQRRRDDRLRAHDLLVGAPRPRARRSPASPAARSAPHRRRRDARPELVRAQAAHVARDPELHGRRRRRSSRGCRRASCRCRRRRRVGVGATARQRAVQACACGSRRVPLPDPVQRRAC